MSGTATDEALNDLTQSLRFANIYTLRFAGNRRLSDDAESFRVTVSPAFVRLPDRLDYLFEATCEPFNTDGDLVADLSLSIIATFDVLENADSGAWSVEAIHSFGGEVALYSVYPYLRQAVQDLGGRIGLPNMTMDLLKRGQPLPLGLALAGVNTEEDAVTQDSNAPHSN